MSGLVYGALLFPPPYREICETFREFENFFHHSGPLHPYVEHGTVSNS